MIVGLGPQGVAVGGQARAQRGGRLLLPCGVVVVLGELLLGGTLDAVAFDPRLPGSVVVARR